MLMMTALWCGCHNTESGQAGKLVEEIPVPEGKEISSIIRNPVSAKEPADTLLMARLTFDRMVHEFGQVKAGEVVEVTFRFQNTGRAPLLISDARSTCGCTVPVWPKTPIRPGESGMIQVKFDTQNQTGIQKKPITITANSYPSETVLYIQGKIESSL